MGAWERLAETVAAGDAGHAGAPATPSAAAEFVALARLHGAQARMTEAIAQAQPLESAICAAVTALCEAEAWSAAWALAEGTDRLPGGATASALGHAIRLHRRRQFQRAWTRIRDLDDVTLARHVPVEAVDAALSAGTPAGRDRAVGIAGHATTMDDSTLLDLAGRLLAFEERASAEKLIAEVRRRGHADLDPRRRHAQTLIERWLERRASAVPAGSLPVAVMGYGSPDPVLTSGNLGDSIQTLSLLGNLVRFSDVTFTGDDGLGAAATELQERVRPDLRLAGVGGAIHLIGVDRDFSSGAAVPEGTWMVALGWHMHPLFDLRYDFPYHPNLRPLFVSFHLNRLDLLSDEACAYMRRYGPVGCRDWNTVFLLLSAGIDAFFTGCMTTTVDGLFPPRAASRRRTGVVGVIDRPVRAADRAAGRVRTYTHQSDAHRYASMTDGIHDAADRLSEYQRDLDRAVSGRLHAYLPLVSLGVPVEFVTSSPGDVRFSGLLGLAPGDARLEELRTGIRDLLAAVFASLLGGASDDRVYELWRASTAHLVAEARARFEAPATPVHTSLDVSAAVARAKAGSRRSGPHDAVEPDGVTDVVLAFDRNLLLPAAVLIESIVGGASGPLRLWILGRDLPDAYPAWLATAFPDLPISVVHCDSIDYTGAGPRRRIPNRITVSTMDRLLLPVLLADVSRVVYLDTDTLVLGDVCELARMDLGGRPIAARDSNVSEASEWQRAGRRLDEPLATELRRLMGLRHGYGHAALNAGVLVLDLDRLRNDDFTATYLGIGERFGLHDQDTLLAYVGADRARIDARWNALPVLEDVADPSLIHWASFGKPWEDRLTYAQDRWREVAERLERRAGSPPGG